jgi:hypothetical protein
MQVAISRKLNHTQSSNMGEGGVPEFKRGVGRKMLSSGCPKQFWDDCIIREAYVRSHTSLDMFGLEGQLPEIKVKGEPMDISTIAVIFGCYHWHWSHHGAQDSEEEWKRNVQDMCEAPYS